MILQYFKKKENEYKIKSDEIYLNILNKSKFFLNKKYFYEINFGTSFELISVFLIFYLHFLKDKKIDSNKKINEELLKHLVNDLDKSLRDVGISDMSIGKYVKKYVKKFYFRLKILDAIFEEKKELDLSDYIKKYGNSLNQDISKINDNLIKLYKSILIKENYKLPV